MYISNNIYKQYNIYVSNNDFRTKVNAKLLPKIEIFKIQLLLEYIQCVCVFGFFI